MFKTVKNYYNQFPIFTKLLLVISVLVIIGIPFSMLCIPYKKAVDLVELDVYKYPIHDSIYIFRLFIIAIGLLLSILSLVITIISFLKRIKTKNTDLIFLNHSIFVFIISIGWKNYPYWANGLYYTDKLSMWKNIDFLLPVSLMGNYWFLPTMLLFVYVFLILPALMISNIVFLILKKKIDINMVLIFVFIALTTFSFFTTPYYIDWLID